MRARNIIVATLCIFVLALIAPALAQDLPDCAILRCTYLASVQYQEPPTATPTNTATVTPLATATPTATATKAPTGVFILGNHSSYVDTIDYLHIVGEVQNNTSQARQFIKITANFFNAGGQLVATDFTYTTLDALRPNDKTCFHLLLKQPAGWASYQFEGVSSSAYSGAFPTLAVLNDSGATGQFSTYHIIGQVRNDGATRTTFVQPIGTLYGAGGTVIGCDFAFVSSTDLDPGQTSAFDVQFIGRGNYTDVSSYRLQVDGSPQ